MSIDSPERSMDGTAAVSSAAHAAKDELCREAFMPPARANRDCRSQQPALQDADKHSQPAVLDAERIRQQPEHVEAANARVTLDSHPAWASGLATPVYQWQKENTARPRGVVLLLHAFPMHGKAYDTLAQDLASRNFICVAPDMRGFGRTSGQKVSYETTCDRDMLDLASAARKQFPGLPLVACGESMGGSFAIRLAAQPGAVDKLIVSGPGLNLQIGAEVDKRDMFLQGARNIIRGDSMDFSNHIRDYYAKDPRVIQEILSDHLVRKQFQLDELLQSPKIAESTKGYISRVSAPVLMLQARDDKMCAPSGVAVMQSKLSSRLKVVEFNDNGHVLIEGSHVRNDVKRAITDWLDREVPPPPQTRPLPRTAG